MSKLTVSAAGGAMPAEGLKTRRAALGALASLPALVAAPAAAFAAGVSIPDPIHAAIERHQKAWDRLTAAINPADEVLAKSEGRKVTDAERNEHEAALAAEEFRADGACRDAA